MKYACIVLITLCLIACASRPSSKPSFDFGNQLAKSGLWQEAIFRWTISLQEEGESASVRNNLAVAYESQGKFAEAEREYKRALELAPDSRMIKENYEQFKKNMEKKQK